jgi:hypothetical protein
MYTPVILIAAPDESTANILFQLQIKIYRMAAIYNP